MNTALAMPAEFTRNPDLAFPLGSMEQEFRDAVGPEAVRLHRCDEARAGPDGRFDRDQSFHRRLRVSAGALARGEAAILRAIELNGAAVESNKQSFQWGRLAAVDLARWRRRDAGAADARFAAALRVARRNDRAPGRVPDRVPGRGVRHALHRSGGAVRAAETARIPGSTALTEAVARYYFKLLAIKDEYEVARLYTEGEFGQRVAAQFEGDYTLRFHLAPPLWGKPDPTPGQVAKQRLRSVDDQGFRAAGAQKRLRGTALDLFAAVPSAGWSGN